MVSVENIIKISSFLTKIHHIKGRIRVRVSPKIKNESNGITIADIESLPKKINGIKSIKINKIVGSITILYDNNIFPYELWEDLLNQTNLENISEILTNLEKEVM
jgi:uncharacterized membrane protein